jgi:hypothetical protein
MMMVMMMMMMMMMFTWINRTKSYKLSSMGTNQKDVNTKKNSVNEKSLT